MKIEMEHRIAILQSEVSGQTRKLSRKVEDFVVKGI